LRNTSIEIHTYLALRLNIDYRATLEKDQHI
jgi:hypothetical protein